MMSRPLPSFDDDRAGFERERVLLARKWVYQLLSTVFVAMPQAELEGVLLARLVAMCEEIHQAGSTAQAHATGMHLVELGCTSDEVLPCTMEALGKGLLSRREFRPAERYAERIMLSLGALASGFAEANRRNTFEQQENMKQSLLKAVRDTVGHLKESEARFDNVTGAVASGVLITDLDGTLVRVNAAAASILGQPGADLVGVNMFDIVHPDNAPALRANYGELLAGTRDRVKQTQRLLGKDGDVATIWLTASLLRDAENLPSNYVTVIEDGTELVLLQNELSRQALHDALTGLPNRQYFSTTLERSQRRADPEYGITVLHLDLDGFTTVCNAAGPQIGDHLLIETGRRLVSAMAAENAMVARLDGDGFGVVVQNCATTPSLTALLAGITRALAEPISRDGHHLVLSACVGVVDRPPTTMEPADLLRAAATTMRRAKASGPGQWQLFRPTHDAADRQADALAAAIPVALDNEAITAVYRPVERLSGGDCVGVEALLRWQHPDLGVLGHHRCVELAIRTGMILSLGERLLRTAADQAGWWRRRYGDDVPLAIEMTEYQARDADLVARVTRVLDDTGLAPTRLVVWLPVRSLRSAQAADNLTELATIGVRTGLTVVDAAPEELGAVQEFPVHSARFSGRLPRRMAAAGAEHAATYAVDSPITTTVRSLVQLIHDSGTTVVVDGIDDDAHAAWWRAAGADLATGAYWHTPESADETIR